MRPTLRFLDPDLIAQIVDEARNLLRNLGLRIHHKGVLSILGDHGAAVDADREHVRLTDEILDRAVQNAPSSFQLFDVLGNRTHDFSGNNVHFTTGSGAINILENVTGKKRKPTTNDYIRFAKAVGGLEHVASQGTAFSPVDVPRSISDSYQLFLSFLYCEKPVVTGPFMTESLDVIRDLQLIVRGGEEELREKPLTVLSFCPATPIEWSFRATQNLLDCARYSIPVQVLSMPLSGSVAPVTMAGVLIQHTAETLSGIVISQLANPGSPILFGGSLATFDVRHEGTPLGGVATMMLDFGCTEIGKWLGFPTQSNASMRNPAGIDSLTGMEPSTNVTLGALAGINNISGVGMSEFGTCLSLERLLVDNEVCGMALRLLRGLEPREGVPDLLLFRELQRKQRSFTDVQDSLPPRPESTSFRPPSAETIGSHWVDGDDLSLWERAKRKVEHLVREAVPTRLPEEVKGQMIRRMEAEGLGLGLDALPSREA